MASSGHTMTQIGQVYSGANTGLTDQRSIDNVKLFNVISLQITSVLTLYMLIFFRVNINMYLYLISFLHIDMTQVVEILPRVRQGPTFST